MAKERDREKEKKKDRKAETLNHLSIHQWVRSAIFAPHQLTSPIGFSFLKLPPPPCAVLLVHDTQDIISKKCIIHNTYEITITFPHYRTQNTEFHTQWIMLHKNKTYYNILSTYRNSIHGNAHLRTCLCIYLSIDTLSRPSICLISLRRGTLRTCCRNDGLRSVSPGHSNPWASLGHWIWIMYSCIHVFMYSCIHVFMYSCMCVRTYVRT